MWNTLLDASIFWSFDRSGFLRHQKNFNETYRFTPGSHALITGGTSGIGKATAQEMAQQGVQVTVTGRDLAKGQEFAATSPQLAFHGLDLADWSGFDALVASLAPLDHLVLNAGDMPESFQTNAQGIELQFASQLFGHYLLAKKLQRAGKLKAGARIVWVTSGGMYLKVLDLTAIKENRSYDKVGQYANVKRAQVTLLPFFKREFAEFTVIAMHPGWADTPGVDSAIPGFARVMRGRLRTPLEGADTILWALSTQGALKSGALYFDRQEVSAHKFPYTRLSDLKAKELEHLVTEATNS